MEIKYQTSKATTSRGHVPTISNANGRPLATTMLVAPYCHWLFCVLLGPEMLLSGFWSFCGWEEMGS